MTKKSRILGVLALPVAFCAAASAARAAAATPPASAGTVEDYSPSFFSGVALSTAYDMIQRLPGFVFDGGDDQQRGFSGTAGNVLIEGQRPTAKTDGLSTILQRIPASQVARIVVIRGAAPGIDMHGHSVIANVLLKQGASTGMIATLDNVFFADGHNAPGGSLEFSRRDGAQLYQVTITRYNTIHDDRGGDGHYTFVTPGATTRGDLKRRGAQRVGWGFNGTAALPLWGGIFGANLTARRTIYNSRILYGAPESATFFSGEKAFPVEIGLNWDGAIGGGAVTLIALERLEQDQNIDTSREAGVAQDFRETRRTGESIVRGTLRYDVTTALNVETGLEGAYNTLDGSGAYVLDGVAQPVPGSQAQVEEQRGQIFVQGTWAFAPGWSLEAGLHGEFSCISALGVPSRSFSFAKPRLLLSWSPTPDHQFRVRVERMVGQLDFSDFIASSDFSGVGISAGNASLRPDSRWQFEGTYEFDFWSAGAFTVSVMHEAIHDLVDNVPVGDGLDGRGNIPEAENNRIKLNLLLPLDRLGDPGGQFKASAQWNDSALRDPVTGATRRISGQRDHRFTFHFIQDIPAWDSSLDFSAHPFGWNRPSYHVAQINYQRVLAPDVGLRWDYQPQPDLDLVFDVENFVPWRAGREYRNYSGPRDGAPLVQVQYLRNVTVPRLYVQLRKMF